MSLAKRVEPYTAGATAARRSRGVPLLDQGTQLAVVEDSGVRGLETGRRGPGWAVTAYPEVGEAVIFWVIGQQCCQDRERAEGRARVESEEEAAAREADNRGRAERRARTNLRRYAVRNGLGNLYTLTFMCQACLNPLGCTCGARAQPASAGAVKRLVHDFVKRLRDHLGRSFPYAYVIERGSAGTRRLHVHVVMAERLPQSLLERVWGHGFVQVPNLNGGKRARARTAARYAGKYVGKALGEDAPEWAHSYERSQGWNVGRVTYGGWTWADRQQARVAARQAMARASVLMSSSSEDWADYRGPPCEWIAYDVGL